MWGRGRRSPRKIGLALGGGGAKGLCHLAFVEALDELGIKPSIIAGTSIGAVIGSFYAAGMSGQEMEALLKENLREIDRMMDVSLFRRSAIKRGKAAEELFYRHIPARSFEELPIPLKVVATDFWNYQQVIISSGELVPAIRASMAMAGVFEPVTLNGMVLVDGGGVNPLPYDIIQDDSDITIAIDVSGQKTPPVHDPVPNVFENLMTTYTIMQSSIVRTKLNFSPPDIYIKPALTNIRATEFHRYDEIIEAVQGDVATFKDELTKRLKARFWFCLMLFISWPRPTIQGQSDPAITVTTTGGAMNERPDYMLACSEIAVVMYPDNQAVGLEMIDPAGQKLFVSLPGNVLADLGKQLQEFSDQHPEVSNWKPVQFQG